MEFGQPKVAIDNNDNDSKSYIHTYLTFCDSHITSPICLLHADTTTPSSPSFLHAPLPRNPPPYKRNPHPPNLSPYPNPSTPQHHPDPKHQTPASSSLTPVRILLPPSPRFSPGQSVRARHPWGVLQRCSAAEKDKAPFLSPLPPLTVFASVRAWSKVMVGCGGVGGWQQVGQRSVG